MIGFLDTEFTDFVSPHLISLGIVAENGDEFYVEIDDYPKHRASGFVKAVVLPFLYGYPTATSYGHAAVRLGNWLEEHPGIILVADFAGDFELLRRLMDEIPDPMPKTMHLMEMFKNPADELAYVKYEQGRDDYYRNVDMRQHHALVDAKAMMAGVKKACLL